MMAASSLSATMVGTEKMPRLSAGCSATSKCEFSH